MRVGTKEVKKFFYTQIIFYLIFYCIIRLVVPFYGFLSLTYIKIILSLILICSFSIIFINKSKSTIINSKEITVLSLIMSIVLSVSVQLVFFQDIVDNSGRSAHFSLIEGTVYNLTWAVIGYVIAMMKNTRYKNSVSLIIVFVLLFIILDASQGSLTISYNYLFDESNSVSELKVSHLTAGFSIYLLLLVSYSIASNRMKIYIFPISIFILFVSGGRTDLGLYIVSIIIYEYMKGIVNSRFLIIAFVLTLGILLLPVLIQIFPSNSQLLSRLTFEGGILEDSSFQARVLLFNQTLDNLPSQFLSGDISKMVKTKGSVGSYSHNLLSAWEFYGFFVFIFIVIILLKSVKRIVSMAKSFESPLNTLVVLVYLTAVIGVMLSKSVDFIFLWICLGMLATNIGSKRLLY